MTNEQIVSMNDYYAKKYGQPIDDNDAISKLVSAYKDLFNEVPNQSTKDGIAEYYRLIKNRDLPAYLWIIESMHVTSKKEKDKRTFSYCIGMLRAWMKNGFGHIPNQEEDELVNYFEEITGFEVTYNTRKILQSLMGNYGLIKVTRMMGEMTSNLDLAKVIMSHLATTMEDKYSTSNTVANKPSA